MKQERFIKKMEQHRHKLRIELRELETEITNFFNS